LYLQLDLLGLKLLLGPAQLGILRLQLDLVDTNFMGGPLRRFLDSGWVQFRRFRKRPPFRIAAQIGSLR